MTKLYKYVILALAVFAITSCSQNETYSLEQDGSLKTAKFDIGAFPGFADVTRAIGVADAGKTAWAAGDEIFVKVTGGQVDNNQNITLVFDGTDWLASDEVYYITTSGLTIKAIWAPGHQMAADGTISLKTDVESGTTEYLVTSCSLNTTTQTIDVKFDTANDRKYSRLRIVPRDAASTVTVVTTGFTPADGGVAPASYTLTTDAKGNAYLYGTWAVSGTVAVSYTISGKGYSKNHTFTSATVGNRSYALSARPLGEIVDPALTSLGDFAMIDGSFVSKDNAATMTPDQLAGCVGIVFWTENEAGTATLATDPLLAIDFPDYNHGLIMALENLIEDDLWQKPNESVYHSFQLTANFTDPNKALYPAILSGVDPTEPIHKIMGYSNTKLLKQYNAYCVANSRSEYCVKPVVALEAYTKSAPDNTTGWYLPSIKELTLLFGADVSDVLLEEPGIADRETLEQLMQTAGVGAPLYSEFDYYWSTVEEKVGYVWFVNAGDGLVYVAPKIREYNALPICAY